MLPEPHPNARDVAEPSLDLICMPQPSHARMPADEPVQVVHEEEEPLVFSFYQDMSKNPHVIKLMLQLNQAIHKVFSMMNKYLDGWRRYDTVYNLWNPKRKKALDKLAEKKHTCVYFDTRIASYELLAETVRAQPSEKDVDFIRIDCYPVALGIAAQADQWKTDYGAVLHQCSSALLEDLCAKMSQVNALKELTNLSQINYRRSPRPFAINSADSSGLVGCSRNA